MTSPRDPEEILSGRDLPAIFRLWEEKHGQSGYDPTPIVKRLAEIFEETTEAYARKNPDPFDERHPSRSDPECELGKSLKLLFKKDNFITKLVSDYLRENYFTRQSINKSSLELNIAACRLILVIMPGLETTAVFQPESDNLINRIYSWAEDGIEPLQSYATGLLGAAMEVSDIAVTFRELNLRLVPKMLKRLQMLQAIYKSRDKDSLSTSLYKSPICNSTISTTPSHNTTFFSVCSTSSVPISPLFGGSAPNSPKSHVENFNSSNNIIEDNDKGGGGGAGGNNSGILSKFPSSSNLSMLIENENSRDAMIPKNLKKYMIPIYPATTETSQMFILRYLTSMGEYQEFLAFIFEFNVMQLIFGYIENLDPRDTCLAFEALKYLSSLLCHKKFALEFVTHGGLELLLKVPRPSIASTGVSITFYYLAYCEDAMERICAMPKKVVSSLVTYSLGLLGSQHDSGKCHAIMFFGLSFQFKVILDEFDNQDGLRKLYNVISVLQILSVDYVSLNEEEETAGKQIIRHVCVALKRYMESHLFFKYHYLMRQQCPSSDVTQPILKATKCTLEQVGDQIRYLQENTPVRMHWSPVDQLLKLGGITLLLRIIAYSYDWNNSGRAETVRSALDVLSVCCIIPRVYSALCDRIELPDNNSAAGINAILGAAFGEVVTDAEVQKSALAVLIHSLCAPLSRPSTVSRFGSAVKKKISNRHAEELVEKVWESVCSNNGIIVLLQLMQIKTPITDADCIRGMACRALSGLARSERVRQIIGKLPLFANGHIQHLMRDPILQEKRVEHVTFQKHALELLERVSGKSKPGMKQLDTASLANIHKANVVAQTRIQYNEQQLLELIYDHLQSKGLHETASMLQKEAGLNTIPIYTKQFYQSPFNFNKIQSRPRFRTKTQELNSSFHGNDLSITMANDNQNEIHNGNNDSITNTNITGDDPMILSNFQTPIKLIRKSSIASNLSSTQNQSHLNNHLSTINHNTTTNQHRSLQKQISATEPLTFISGPSTSSMIDQQQIKSKNITLGTIVTEYLTNQHSLCNNPMSTCPQFDLFIPHKCPDPKPNRIQCLENNLTARFFKAQSGYNTMRLDRRFVHMQFNSIKTIRPQDYNEMQFTCCDYLPCNNSIIIGTSHGDLKVYNVNDGNEEYGSQCHNSYIDYVKVNREGNLAISSCSWRPPLTILWSINNREFFNKLSFEDDFYCEFSNLQQDKILGTKMDCATIYDLNTGRKILTLKPTISNQYTKNRATFCPTDELILSDGVLWDVRSGREIHKFDKLNQTLSGVFHPNGLEIVSNTEVWDLRTFHLLQTVPVLDQCLIKFSPLNVIYGINTDVENRTEYDETNSFDTSFKVLDSFDYSSISTIDVKRNIYDLSINTYGSHIALVENQLAYDSVQESMVKIYAAGVRKSDEDEDDEDEELQSEENSGSDSDSSSRLPIFRLDNEGRMRPRRRHHRRNNDGDNNDNDNDGSDSSDDDDDDDDNDGEDDDSDQWIDLDTSSSDNGDHNNGNDDDAVMLVDFIL